MKKKKLITYILSGLIPVLIFLICSTVNGFLPFGKEMINAYDSFTQYPGMIIELGRALRCGDIFYSWHAGLGFNFYGTITYYGFSPLNLISIISDSSNYHFIIAFMTYVRFFLLGVTMCFYLSKKNTSRVYTVLFSIAFALMGYTATYYYNFMWIDSIIMLPLIIYGLEKLIDTNNSKFYIITLTLSILFNYYIGYMICIFSLIYYFYKALINNKVKETIKTFIISSLLVGLMCAIVLIPSYYALKTGKASLFVKMDYFGITNNYKYFFNSLMTGNFQSNDQSYGPAQIYSSILVFVLSILYFFNTKYSKKEKLLTLSIILFFYISFFFNLLNYGWQFFQKPIWWQSRFSFLFSFFLISISSDNFMNIEKVKIRPLIKVLITALIVVLILVSSFFKYKDHGGAEVYTYIFLGFSLIIFIELMFVVQKKDFLLIIILFTLTDITINTYNSVKSNYRYKSYDSADVLKSKINNYIEKMESENTSFYRFELLDDYTSDDGMYFGYNGINYFNSARNIKVTNLMTKLGQKVTDNCHIYLTNINPIYSSIFGLKYIYGSNDYYEEIEDNLYVNNNALGIGFASSNIIEYTTLGNDANQNYSNILNSILGEETNIYSKIDYKNFKLVNSKYDDENNLVKIIDDKKSAYVYYEFTSNKDYFVILDNPVSEVYMNDELINKSEFKINKGDKLKLVFNFVRYKDFNLIDFYLLDIDDFNSKMSNLKSNLLKGNTNVNGHIFEGNITTTNKKNMVFTSIEYEDGMTIYVDGKKIKPTILLNSLIGLRLNPGEHKIVIDYIPKGFIQGAIISGISLIVVVFYLQKRKKNL